MDAEYYVNECLSAKKFADLWKHCEQSSDFHRIVYLEDSMGKDSLDLAQIAGAVVALTKDLEAYGVPYWVLREGSDVSGEKILDFCGCLRARSKKMRSL